MQNRSTFTQLLENKTSELVRFMELKHRFWAQFKTQLPENVLKAMQNLFVPDSRVYLFKANFEGKN